MQLDISIIKNESIVKFEKALKQVKNKFEDMLSIALDAAIREIDGNKRTEVEVVLSDIINDEFGKFIISFTHCMNKCSDVVETSF